MSRPQLQVASNLLLPPGVSLFLAPEKPTRHPYLLLSDHLNPLTGNLTAQYSTTPGSADLLEIDPRTGKTFLVGQT